MTPQFLNPNGLRLAGDQPSTVTLRWVQPSHPAPGPADLVLRTERGAARNPTTPAAPRPRRPGAERMEGGANPGRCPAGVRLDGDQPDDQQGSSEPEFVAVQVGQQAHGNGGSQRLLRVTAALSMHNQFPDLLRRCGAADLQHHLDFLERPARTVQPELVRRAEAASDLRGCIQDLDPVQRREPRRLGQQSGRHTEQQVLQRRRRGATAAPVGRLV
jgi:hypothetical protein